MEYIKLQHAHVTQHTNGATKTDWSIEENITDTVLGTLPKVLNDEQVFHILDFVRKYELEAFNSGIAFGKNQYLEVYQTKLTQLEENLKLTRNENERLAEALELLTSKK